ncbi:16S rRNA (cytosine(967)-C(5))-methyltransferase RsmB [Desulfococcaceae bacterium HSG8]|nr:16S rRNA (cytosine(967)-C(5))-methyltransferase RsmB [Desulfococcaceae bacterium HSG8]
MDDARGTALIILNTRDKNRKTLDSILEDVADQKTFSKRDRSLLYALVYGVLRWRGRLDRIIAHFSKTRLDKIAPEVLNILRLGLFQIVYLDRIPVSAAVNTSVEMSKQFAAPWVVRFVNGVLRNAARGYETVTFPDIAKHPVSALAADKSFPEWLIRRWVKQFGPEETRNLCDAVNTIPPITVRTNTLRTTREKLIKALEDDAGNIEPAPYAPDGISFSNPRVSLPETEAFKKGWFQVQDEAAQLTACLLNPQPGDTVLDACAGLGGKTGHIAQMMKNKGRIVAADKDHKKLMRLSAEMERLGVSIVTTCVNDLDKPGGQYPCRLFDRILLDAPCSGLGVIRRNPDTKWYLSEPHLKRYKKRQIKFSDNVARFVKPSGILVYAVCSTEPEETHAVTEAFLRRHPEFVRDPLPATAENWQGTTDKGQLTTSPRDNMDGFFAIRFRRIR